MLLKLRSRLKISLTKEVIVSNELNIKSQVPFLSNRQNGLQQKPMEAVYQREVEISPGPRSSVMKERPERKRATANYSTSKET
ncbi:jg23674 [Pararge aegeria aegeria]|uniref:Jg23674 protein n=1 Tax=Pararge aegeria aegeria TaxID=348720 RepID=A0A8S4RB24_9NEOP|nr:jg23674 [Pararge aegeria aegeria]